MELINEYMKKWMKWQWLNEQKQKQKQKRGKKQMEEWIKKIEHISKWIKAQKN